MSGRLDDIRIISNEAAADLRERVIDSLPGNLRKREGDLFASSQKGSGKNVLTKYFGSGEVMPQILCETREQQVHMIYASHQPDLYEIRRDISRSNLPKTTKQLLIEKYAHSTETSFREMLKICDGANRAGVEKLFMYITAFPDARQDKKDQPNVPISAGLNLSEIVNASGGTLRRFGTIDLHAKQIQGMIQKPVDEIQCFPIYIMHMKQRIGDLEDVVIILPDAGSYKRYQTVIDKLGLSRGYVPKSRDDSGELHTDDYQGDPLDGKTAVVWDDMVDSGSTLVGPVKFAFELGAKQVYGYCTTGYMSTKIKDEEIVFAEDTLRKTGVKLICSDNVPRTDLYREENSDWLEMFSVAPLIGDLMYCNIDKNPHGIEIGRMNNIAYNGSIKDINTELARLFVY